MNAPLQPGTLSVPGSSLPRSRRCLRCDRPLPQADTGPDRETCSEACKKAVQRRRGPLARTIRLVLRALDGEAPVPPPPFWGLLVRLVSAERARLRAERRAAVHLPSPPAPPPTP